MLTQIFMYEGSQVRTVIKDGEPHWVARDVCEILEISNVTDALKRLEEDERTLVSIEGASNGLPVNAVNEFGLYSLIIGSRKTEAKEFKRWIIHEVIPQIRKTGSYVNPTYAIEDGIIHAMQGMKQLKEENVQLKIQQEHQSQELTTLKLVVDNEIWLNDHQKADIQDRVKNRCGVLQHMGYQSSFQGIYSALKTHFNVPKYDKIPRKDYEKALDFIRGWYPKKQAR